MPYRKLIVAGILTVIAIISTAQSYFFFPWQDRTYTIQQGDRTVRVEEERRYRWLGCGEWGFVNRERFFICRGNTLTSVRTLWYGIFEMTDSCKYCNDYSTR